MNLFIKFIFQKRTMPKFIKRHQKSFSSSSSSLSSGDAFKNKHVFGVPLRLVYQRQGQSLPQAILQIMKYLRKNSMHAIGIFRKSGSKIRMQIIREQIEKHGEFNIEQIEKKFIELNDLNQNLHISSNISKAPSSSTAQQQQQTQTSQELNSIGSGLSSQSTSKSDITATSADSLIHLQETTACLINTEMISIDLADILKQYFRELPECLFTNKLSQTLIEIFTCIYNILFYSFNIKILKFIFYAILFLKICLRMKELKPYNIV
jgi:hypothetical protein